VISRTSRKKVGSRGVVVKETHLDSSMWAAKADGRPNSGRRAGIFSHSEVKGDGSRLISIESSRWDPIKF
jgi:hypothetical protein